MTTAMVASAKPLDQTPSYDPPRKYSYEIPRKHIQAAEATTIKWGSKVYLLHQQSVSAIDFTELCSVEVFSRNTRRPIYPTTMELSRSGFVLGLPNGKVEVWDVNGSKVSSHRSSNADESPVQTIATFGNGILCGTNQLTLFDARQQNEVWSLWNKHETPIQSVSFASSYILGSGSSDRFCLWDIRNSVQPLARLNRNTMAHHWCGPRMVSAGTDGVARLWEMTETRFKQIERCKLTCSAVYLTPDCEAAISLGRLFIRRGEEVDVKQTAHETPPSAISPDRKTLVTQSKSGYLSFFSLA